MSMIWSRPIDQTYYLDIANSHVGLSSCTNLIKWEEGGRGRELIVIGLVSPRLVGVDLSFFILAGDVTFILMDLDLPNNPQYRVTIELYSIFCDFASKMHFPLTKGWENHILSIKNCTKKTLIFIDIHSNSVKKKLLFVQGYTFNLDIDANWANFP